MKRWSFTLKADNRGGGAKKSPALAQLQPFGMLENESDASLASSASTSHTDAAQLRALKVKKSWEVAKSPVSGIFMNMFMAWMAGSQLNIFSIMIVGMMLFNPTKAIYSVNATFSKLDDGTISLTLQKAAFVALQLALLGIGVYKCHGMGLLPTSESDYAAVLSLRQPVERSELIL